LKAWNDSSNEGLKKNISKGEMLIILNAGGDNGFVPETYCNLSTSLTFIDDFFSSLIWCIVGCRIPSDEILRKNTKQK
jgi:hypothetical protein